MGAHVDHIQENNNQATVIEAPQVQSVEGSVFEFEDKRPESIQMAKLQGMANEGFQSPRQRTTNLRFIDNRPETVVFQKMQEMADNSAQVSQFKVFQDWANPAWHIERNPVLPFHRR